jgi:hypothetical protein
LILALGKATITVAHTVMATFFCQGLTYHSAKLLSSAQQKALNKELFAVKTIGE